MPRIAVLRSLLIAGFDLAIVALSTHPIQNKFWPLGHATALTFNCTYSLALGVVVLCRKGRVLYYLNQGEKLPRIAGTNEMGPKESPRPRPRERSHHHEKRRAARSHAKSRYESSSSQSGSQLLSANALAKLNQLNQQESVRAEEVTPKRTRRKRHREIVDEKLVVEKSRRQHKRKKRRVVSGALLEEGDSYRLKGIRTGDKYEQYDDGRRKKRLCRPLPHLILDTQS